MLNPAEILDRPDFKEGFIHHRWCDGDQKNAIGFLAFEQEDENFVTGEEAYQIIGKVYGLSRKEMYHLACALSPEEAREEVHKIVDGDIRWRDIQEEEVEIYDSEVDGMIYKAENTEILPDVEDEVDETGEYCESCRIRGEVKTATQMLETENEEHFFCTSCAIDFKGDHLVQVHYLAR